MFSSVSSYRYFVAYSTTQTHTTPVLLGFKDRAELAGGEYVAHSSVMEGVVVVEKVDLPPV